MENNKQNLTKVNSNDNRNSKETMLEKIIEKSLICSKSTFNRTGKIIEAILMQNKEELKLLCSQGLPDDLPILRSLIWKINLGYLSINSEEWNESLRTQRDLYNYYKTVSINKLKEEIHLFDGFEEKSNSEKKALEEGTNKPLLEDIAKDINRTHMQFSFFFQSTNKAKVFNAKEIHEMIENRRNCTLKNINDTYKINICETHADVMARILFIFAKFAPDVGYVQGMNEILAPIYYCFSYDKTYKEETIDNIEADAFWAFYNLMQKLKYVFIREEDRSERGINRKAESLKKMINIIDNDISMHFEKYKLDFSSFSYRWFILLFSQDFLIIDILRLWDYIFSEDNPFKNVYYIALAIMLMKKDIILVSDLSGMISELQNLNGLDIEKLIKNAKFLQRNTNKYIEPLI